MRSLIIPAILFLYSCSTSKGLDSSRLVQFDPDLEREIRDDINGDDIEDIVRLLPAAPGENHHVLEISLSQGETFRKYVIKNLVTSLSTPGASLEPLDNDSFKIVIDHSNAGNTAGLREYTVSWNGGSFIVSGITVSEYHQVNPELGGSCDINLVTGVGERNNKAIRIKGLKRDIASVDSEWLPKECKF